MCRFFAYHLKNQWNHPKSQCLDCLKKHLSHSQNQHVLAVCSSSNGAAAAAALAAGIRSRKQGDTDGTSNIVLPCPGS
jgi:hypothetical protein